MKKITITIDENGAIEMEGHGFKGKACQEKMEALIKSLGVTVSSKKKPEFYQEDRRTVSN